MRIHGKTYEVKARIAQIHGLSAHADRHGLLEWLGELSSSPKKVFLNHGEKESINSLKEEIIRTKGWNVVVPEYRKTYIIHEKR